MFPEFEYGHKVRVMRTIRNDGTYPGKNRGDLLVQRGSVGYVRDVGTFLQDQLIYRVHFVELGMQIGCRDTELIDSRIPWQDRRFDVLQRVTAGKDLVLAGQCVVNKGDPGQIIKVAVETATNDDPSSRYQVRFADRVLLVSELALVEMSDAELQ